MPPLRPPIFEKWKHKLPTRETIFASRWFRPFTHWFDKPEYWRLSRDKVALSVAIGLFATLYTNPLILIPLYVAAYELGSWLLYGNAPHPAHW